MFSILFSTFGIIYPILLSDQNESAMDTTEQQDYAVDGVSVHQQDINTQAKNVQDGGGTMNGIYILICLLVILHTGFLGFCLETKYFPTIYFLVEGTSH